MTFDKRGKCRLPSNFIERNAVGLAWISHPVTVQSGALIVQELLGRPEVHKDLRAKAATTRSRGLAEWQFSRLWCGTTCSN